MLCKNMRGGRNGDELTQDILGHFDIVLRDHQCFLDVLVRVSLTHEVLDLATDLRVGIASCRPTAGWSRDRRDGTRSALRVDSSGQGLWRSLWGFHWL